jgi:hypothetical protein
MYEIRKVYIPLQDEAVFVWSEGAAVLHFALQNGNPTLWYMEDPTKAPSREYKFYMRGTGHKIDPAGKKYIGTVTGHQGIFVWHLFMEVK